MKSYEQDAKRNLFQWQQKELLLKIIGLEFNNRLRANLSPMP